MSIRPTYPTAHADVNALTEALRIRVDAILGSQRVGIYLHGSLANGDFDPERSDVDLLVATAGELTAPAAAALEAMHREIAASNLKWAKHYEVSYIPVRALHRHDPANCMHIALGADGTFGLDRHGSDWIIQRHILRERGLVVAGPQPELLVDPVSAADLRLAVRGILQEWWRPHLDDHTRLCDSEYQAFAVLTMCRALHTLETAVAGSKPQAVRWAHQNLPGQWLELIKTAMAWRHGGVLNRLDEVLDLVRYAIDRSESV